MIRLKPYPRHAEHIMEAMGYPPKWQRMLRVPVACFVAIMIGASMAEIAWPIMQIMGGK